MNLGNRRAGPVYEQSMKVFNAINAKNGVVHARFRGVMLANIPDWLATSPRNESRRNWPSGRR